jgi:hypothetical protein
LDIRAKDAKENMLSLIAFISIMIECRVICDDEVDEDKNEKSKRY